MTRFHVVESTPREQTLLDFEEYLDLIKQIESNHQEICHNTRLMLTKFRKAFYNSFGWNDELIRGTASVKPFKKLPSAFTPKNHLIQLSNGDLFDIAHIFAILDSANHPGLFTPLPDFLSFLHPIFPTVKSRLMAAGWLGDLSSVTGQYFFKSLHKDKPLDDNTKQAVIDQYAPAAKVLSDIDSMVIANIYNVGSSNGLKVSQILENYYRDSTIGAEFRSHRTLLFCELIGLKGWNGESFANESEWVAYYTKQLKTCTSFYLFFFRKTITTVFQSLLIWLGFYKSKVQAEGTLRLFLQALKSYLQATIKD